MSIPITVPRLGWNMEEGTFVEWIKADGDTVRPGDLLFRLEGEKSVEEIEAFDAGVLHVPADGPKPGDRVLVGATIGHLLQPGEVKPTREPTAPTPVSHAGETGGTAAASNSSVVEPAASPSVRRLARQHGVELQAVRGTGRGGRVTATDVESAVKSDRTSVSRTKPTISPRARRLADRHGFDWTSLRGSGRTGRIRERDIAAALAERSSAAGAGSAEVIPLTTRRKTIAARMVESQRATAPVTLNTMLDASNLVNLREQFKAVAKADGRPVPAYTDFLLKLVAFALQKHPLLTAQWGDAGLRVQPRIDVGLAVDTDAGLLVPVVRDVPALGLRQVVEQTRLLVDRARQGALTARDMEGGCFTVTSLGAYGIDTFTPIINYPECAILGVGQIKRVPVMDGDRVVGRDQLSLSLTFDHRVLDGAPAARFLQTLTRMVEAPGPWLAT